LAEPIRPAASSNRPEGGILEKDKESACESQADGKNAQKTRKKRVENDEKRAKNVVFDIILCVF